ncbi:MAG: hypothetical protein KAU62_04065 [Candidatus Heimdallarchaeota archaeon]|nr:hypothetical protein [Candidatus Heimdallarchaeota archaeon]MCK4610312.1 hypothetical protein [Candidatus Heimdallarchaeota archaeon]
MSELEELKKQFRSDTSVPEEYHIIMDYIKENTEPNETGIRNKMAIWFLNTLGKSIDEIAAILNLKPSTVKNYRYELIRKKLIDEDGYSHVDFEHTSVDICLKILTLKGLVVVTEVEENE